MSTSLSFLSFLCPRRTPDPRKRGLSRKSILVHRRLSSDCHRRRRLSSVSIFLWQVFLSASVSEFHFCRHHMSYTYCFEDHSNLQAAAGADSNLLPIAKISKGDLELVATGTWVSIECRSSVVGHIFNFDLIVERHFVFPESSARR